MRVRSEENGISVNAISGTHAVVFGLDANKESRNGLLGFAIGWRLDPHGQSRWLRGFKFFEQIVPNPRPGDRGDTRDHPIQTFLWGHYSAAPGQDYLYTIRPVYGSPKRPLYGHDINVNISTSAVDLGHHAVFFNRGAIASQEFADLFGNRGPQDVSDASAEHVTWLSRGLLRGALDFIGLAKDRSWGLRVAAFRFTYHPILEALVAAARRGVDVGVIYEGGNRKIKGVVQATSTAVENRAAIIAHQLHRYETVSLIERRNCRSDPNNNFIVLLEKDRPLAIWTGSTDFTSSGFLGQSNVGHIVRGYTVARAYLSYWNELAKDPLPESLRTWNSRNHPMPKAALETGVTAMFCPRNQSKMLDWYGDRLEEAKHIAMIVAPSGVTKRLAKRFYHDNNYLRYLLREESHSTQKQSSMLSECHGAQVTIGANLNSQAIQLGLPGDKLDQWFRDELHLLNKRHISYLNIKMMLIDVLNDEPYLFSGSANFSPASILLNDENMLLIRGNTNIADIYMTEFMRLLNHFYFRHIAAKLANKGRMDTRAAAFLEPTDRWVGRHFRSGNFRFYRRKLFR